MQSNQLKRIHPNKKRMIVARGGKRGKTSGRGGKGQSARAGNKRRPEWRDIIKRVPKLRGRGKNSNKPFQERPIVVNLVALENVFSTNDAITPTILVEKGVIATLSGNIPAVKILGDGEITKALKISGCFISDSAKEKVIKAGGSFTPVPSKILIKTKTPAQIKKASEPKKAKAPKVEAKVEKTEKAPKKDKKDSKVESKKDTKKSEVSKS
ncbi:MAG: uL15 family ribosomal protein [Candidatus Paceibacterota bacterium]